MLAEELMKPLDGLNFYQSLQLRFEWHLLILWKMFFPGKKIGNFSYLYNIYSFYV